MIWILVLVALVAASAYGAHRLLGSVDGFGPLGGVGTLPRPLVYAAAIVVACQAADAAVGIHHATGHQYGL
jgi:hypothetical protein